MKIPSWGLMSAASIARTADRSGRSRHSSRRARSRTTTPTESTWPHSALSNHVTGLATTMSAPIDSAAAVPDNVRGVVTWAYRRVLLRDPDDAGFWRYAGEVMEHGHGAKWLRKTFKHSDEMQLYYEVSGLESGTPYEVRLAVRRQGGGGGLFRKIFGGGGAALSLKFAPAAR